jgi:hypothetical protein
MPKLLFVITVKGNLYLYADLTEKTVTCLLRDFRYGKRVPGLLRRQMELR